MIPLPILLIDIDGLRPDVFQAALEANRIPNIARLLGGPQLRRGMPLATVAPAPSITFCSQASLFTGSHPKEHGIVGNQFFDRLGYLNDGTPSYFAFDVGDTLAYDDAVRVFAQGLASQCLRTPTFYEKMARKGYTSVVAGNMYAQGATSWIKPSLLKLARFIKGGSLFGLTSADYDGHILKRLLKHLRTHGLPDIVTMYFLGIDHDSHKYGPQAQSEYLISHVDPMIGQLWDTIQTLFARSSRRLDRQISKIGPIGAQARPFVALFSDHGQIPVIDDESHCLRVGSPFDHKVGSLFGALGLDIHDYPEEIPHCDAVMGLNGGLADVYLKNGTGNWADRPLFERDVLPVGRAFWEAHLSGKYVAQLHGALAGVLVRNVQRDGWDAPYQALTPAGQVISLEEWFAPQLAQKTSPQPPKGPHNPFLPLPPPPASVRQNSGGPRGGAPILPHASGRWGAKGELYVDPVNRLHNRACVFSGDLLLISNYTDGYYFGAQNAGTHGGLHPEDSYATLAYGWPDASEAEWKRAKDAITQAIQTRCRAEGNRHPSTTDMITGLEAVLSLHISS